MVIHLDFKLKEGSQSFKLENELFNKRWWLISLALKLWDEILEAECGRERSLCKGQNYKYIPKKGYRKVRNEKNTYL